MEKQLYFRNLIKARRNDLKKTFKDPTISQWATGRRIPENYAMAKRIADCLKVSVRRIPYREMRVI